MGLLFVNQTYCREVIEVKKRESLGLPVTAPDGVRLYEYERGERAAEIDAMVAASREEEEEEEG